MAWTEGWPQLRGPARATQPYLNEECVLLSDVKALEKERDQLREALDRKDAERPVAGWIREDGD